MVTQKCIALLLFTTHLYVHLLLSQEGQTDTLSNKSHTVTLVKIIMIAKEGKSHQNQLDKLVGE